MHRTVLALLALAAPALAEAAPEGPPADSVALAPMPSPPPPASATPHPDEERPPAFGVGFDAGFPDGAAVAALWRPVQAIRLSFGPSWNYVGWGLEGGVALVPWHWAVSPVIAVDAGRYFDSDLSGLARQSAGVPAEVKPLLEKVGYTYASLQLGLELGSQRGFSFSLRAGLSYFDCVAHGTATTRTSGGVVGAGDAVVELTNPRVRAVLPSLKLGVQYFF
jgi:hypothetical protein